MITLQRAQVLAWRLAQHGLSERGHPPICPKSSPASARSRRR